MEDDQQFCLRWNNHQSTLVSVFDTLLEKGIHVDCTLAAEGQTLKAHKVVLSACSPYFESVLSQQFDKHPIIILKDVKYAELRAMMDYMYRGEVNISQDQLGALLKAAESLQIKGLSDNKPSRPPSRPAVAPVQPLPALPALPTPAVTSVPAIVPVVPVKPPLREDTSESRDGSVSPSRRRKKPRRGSTEIERDNGEVKEENPRDGVEDLTLDEEHDESMGHNDVVRNFQWHMERSQDEMLNSTDAVRDSQDRKDLPSALLSLLSSQRAHTLAAVPSAIQLTSIGKDLPFPPPLLPKLDIPENIKAHLLQQAFLNNNVSMDYKKEEQDSDAEYDDTDDIVLPDETDPYYENFLQDPNGERKDMKYRRDGSSSDDASRQFECRHCGKKYRWKSTLRRHENVECGGKAPSHQCPYCSYKAKQRGNLGVHIRKHHNNEWYIYASNKVRKNKKTSNSEPVGVDN